MNPIHGEHHVKHCLCNFDRAMFTYVGRTWKGKQELLCRKSNIFITKKIIKKIKSKDCPWWLTISVVAKVFVHLLFLGTHKQATGFGYTNISILHWLYQWFQLLHNKFQYLNIPLPTYRKEYAKSCNIVEPSFQKINGSYQFHLNISFDIHT